MSIFFTYISVYKIKTPAGILTHDLSTGKNDLPETYLPRKSRDGCIIDLVLISDLRNVIIDSVRSYKNFITPEKVHRSSKSGLAETYRNCINKVRYYRTSINIPLQYFRVHLGVADYAIKEINIRDIIP